MKKSVLTILFLLSMVVSVRAQKTQEIDSLMQVFNQGNYCVCYEIGVAYLELEDYKSAIEWFEKCDQAYTPAQEDEMEEKFGCYPYEYLGLCNLRVGDCFYEGHGGKEDCKKALWCYESALVFGLEDCPEWLLDRMYARMGSLHRDGIGTRRNLKKAFECYSTGARDYYGLECMYELALCYLNGWGTKRDINSGLSWLAQAAYEGDEESASLLKDLEKAHPDWFEDF